FLSSPFFQLLLAGIDRGRPVEGLLRGSRDASQKNRGGGDGDRGPIAGIVRDVAVWLSDDGAEPGLVARAQATGCSGGFHHGDDRRLRGGHWFVFLGRRFPVVAPITGVAAEAAEGRVAGTVRGRLPRFWAAAGVH